MEEYYETKDYYVFEEENRFHKSKFTLEQAKNAFSTLEYCKNCTDCTNSFECENCIDCKNCVICTNCKNCNHCETCETCQNCINCKDCISCTHCFSCQTCETSNKLSFLENQKDLNNELIEELVQE